MAHAGAGSIFEAVLVIAAIFIAFGIVTSLDKDIAPRLRNRWIAAQLLFPVVGTVLFLAKRYPTKGRPPR